jgi:PAS domain S-box-containing protein
MSLLSRIKEYLSPPQFPDDEEKTRQGGVLHTVLIASIGFLLVDILIAIPFLFVEKVFNGLMTLALLIIAGLAFWLMRRGRVRLAAALFIWSIWFIFTLFLPFAGGIRSVVIIYYIVGVVLAGLLLGTRGAILQVVASSLSGLVMTILEIKGYAFPRVFPIQPIVAWLDVSMALFLAMMVVSLVIRSMREALNLTRQRLAEQKHAEISLRDSEAKFRNLFETSRDILYISTIDGHIADFNTSAVDITGFSEDELRLLKIQELYANPADREGLIRKIQEQGYAENVEIQGKKKDGSYIDVLVNAQGVRDKSGRLVGMQGSIKDISERKRAEEALRASEEKFRTMIEQASEGFALVDEDTRVIEWNHAEEQIWGLKREDVLGKYFYDVQFQRVIPEHNTPERYEFLKTTVQEAIRTGQSPIFHRRIEAELCHPDGKRFFIQQRVFPIQTERGFRIASMTSDITDRKKAEENVIRQVERLRALHTIEQAILSSMDLSMILKLLVREVVQQLHVDAVDFLLFDPRLEKLNFTSGEGFRTKALQYTSLDIGAGLAGRAARERQTVHIPDLSEVKDNPTLSQAISGETFVAYYAVPLIAKDQLHGVLEIFHRSPLAPDPDWTAFLEALAGQAAISIDNARLLEKTQQSLQETNALYQINQDLAESIEAERLMSKVVELLQKNFNYHYVQIFTADPAAGDFVMRAGSGTIGREMKKRGHRLAAGVGIVGFTADTGLPFFSNNVDDVLFYVKDPLLPNVKSELAVPIKNGDEFLGLLDVHQVPPAFLTERDVHMVTAVADQLAVSLQKAHLYSDLQDALKQEQATRSQLIHSERLAIAGRLLASVSHELNNPLQAIQNALFLLKDEVEISSQGKQDLNIVLAETERMATMLERLRTTYRPLHEEDFRPVQINNLIENVHALMATHLRHHGITYEFHPEANLPDIPGLPDQLQQVILNLFMNAVEAMSSGGCLTVATARSLENRNIILTVKDTGPGIDPEILPSIFEAFVTNKEGGTGLGLAIVYEIVNKHGGHIQAVNDPGGGALFMVDLPCEKQEVV